MTTPPALSGDDSYPVFSPDGTQLAFIRNLDGQGVVHVVAASGGEPRLIGQNGYAGLAWAADDRLVLPSPPRDGGSPLWSLSAKDGSSRPMGIGGENTLYPAVSLQGHLLAFTRWNLNTNVWRVELAHPPDGALNDLQASREVMLISSKRRQASPRFSPDGSQIVFASDRSGSMEIWKCDREGNNPVRLTSIGGPLTGNPRWSPDGQWIAFDSRHEGNANIYVVSAESGPLRAITTKESEDIVPSWSHDGKWIYFASDRGGDQQIWRIPADGGAPLQVTRRGGFEAFESFEGGVVYYSRPNGELGLWQVRPDGSDERPVPGLSQAGHWRYWTVGRDGVYFVPGVTANQLYPATIVLSNGDRLTGEVSGLEKGKLALKTDYAGTVQIDWAMVREFDADQRFEIATQSGRRYTGTLRRSADTVEVVTDAERASFPPVDVTGLAPLSDGEPPSFWQRLDGAIDAGYSFTRGNADLTQSSLAINSEYAREKYKAQVTASSIFSRQDDAPSTSRHAINGRVDRFFGPRALAFVLAGLERNDRQQLNLRTNTGGGLGWRLVKSKNTQLSIRGGITFTNEQFNDGVELSSGEALGQIEWKTLQFGKVELSTDARFYPSLTRSGRYRIEYDSTMWVPLLSQLTWSLSLFDRFDTDPPLPVQRNDYGLVSAFGFTF